VFSWSYVRLSDPAARMFRLLGIHHGPDISVPAAASLAGMPRDQARVALTELTHAHLLTQHNHDRYACHDLLRAYAAGQARLNDSDADRREAIHRVLDHYLHTTHSADGKLHQPLNPLVLPATDAGVTPEELADRSEALIWYQAERQVLLAAITRAAEAGFDNHAWQIPATIAGFLRWQGHWQDWRATQQTALAAAQRLGNRHAQARAGCELGTAASKLRHYDDAREHFERALNLYRELGDLLGQAHVHENLGWSYQMQGRASESLGCTQRALDLYREAGHLAGQANMLSNTGWLYVELGDYQQAITRCEQGLPLLRELGHRLGEAACLDSLGYAHHHQGSYEQALNCYNKALNLLRQQGHPLSQAYVLSHLGDTYHTTRNHSAAHDSWRQALAIFDELQQPDSREIRAKLAQLPRPQERENPQ
jgi:tetratricopeptide (TPR) repeat protein